MKIVIFGEDIFTTAALESLLDHKHEIAAVICPAYDNDLEYKSLEKAAAKNGIPFLREKDVNAGNIKDQLFRGQPDLIVCVHLRKILRRDIFSIPRNGAINIHPSLLPKYRGLSPQHQALLHGDKETGVTIHFIEEGVDTGAIIVQKHIPLSAETYIYELQLEMLAIYRSLIPDAIRLIGTEGFNPVKQGVTKEPYYGALKDSDREINLKKTTFEIHNLIRAVSKPYKGAWYQGITVWTSFVADPAAEKELMKDHPDVGIYKDETQLVIRLRDGFLLSDDFEIAAQQK